MHVELSKAWPRDPSMTGITGSYLAEGVCVSLLCQVEVSAAGQPLVQKHPTECGVPECDGETSTWMGPWPTRAMKQKNGFIH